MHFSLAILAAASLASCVVSASGLYPRQIPNCATGCLTSADLGGCSATDNACLCSNQAFVDSVTACIAGSCTGADLTAATTAAQALCAAAGVTLTGTVPTSSASSTATATSPAATGTGASSTTGSSSAAPASTSNAALSNGVNALAGMAAFGLALAL